VTRSHADLAGIHFLIVFLFHIPTPHHIFNDFIEPYNEWCFFTPCQLGRLPSLSLPRPAHSFASAIVTMIDLGRRISWECESAKILSRMMKEANAQSRSRVRTDDEVLPCLQKRKFLRKRSKEKVPWGEKKTREGGMTGGTGGVQGQGEGRKPHASCGGALAGESSIDRRKYRHKFLSAFAGTAVNSALHSCCNVSYYTTSRTMYPPSRVNLSKVGSRVCGAEA